ncbi:MAG: hypothetical protein D6731_08395 [Planctomycetota bacterium]|nr:MAG: hypothetical protein D6731_08395 [Planctomycetota bacterium]
MVPAETTTGFLSFARRRPGADRWSDEAWSQLDEHARSLGLVGLLVAACCDPDPQVVPEVRDELFAALGQDLGDALGEEGSAPLSDRMNRFAAARGEAPLASAVARVAFEVYDLAAHSFVVDDVLRAGRVMAHAGPGRDAREAVRQLIRLSRRAARSALGHLDGQLEVVHRLGNPELPIDYPDLDRRVGDYAPRLFAQRLPSLVASLLHDCRRTRFVFVLWARLRGVVIGKAHLAELADRIDPRDPLRLVEGLLHRRATCDAIARAAAAAPEAHRIEAAFLASA